MRRNKKYLAGFSLIELMVVIAIIGLLSSLVLATLASARKKSRETKRKADLVQLGKALELYYNANNGYPTTASVWFGTSANGGSKTTSGATAYIPGLTPTYLGNLPLDPLKATTGWSGYNYKSDGTSYKLILSDVGPESFPASTEPFYDPIRPTTAWMICAGTQTACTTW